MNLPTKKNFKIVILLTLSFVSIAVNSQPITGQGSLNTPNNSPLSQYTNNTAPAKQQNQITNSLKNEVAYQLKGASYEATIILAKNLFTLRAEHYERLADFILTDQLYAAYSPADKAILKNHYTNLSNQYKNTASSKTAIASNLKYLTTNFKIAGHQIPDRAFGGRIPVSANPLTAILAVAEVSMNEYDRLQIQKDFPNIDLSTSFGAIALDFARSVGNSITFGVARVERTSYDPNDVMPSGAKYRANWLSDMETHISNWTQEKIDLQGGIDRVRIPAGVLQYIQFRKEASDQLMAEFDIAYSDPFEWANEWDLWPSGSGYIARKKEDISDSLTKIANIYNDLDNVEPFNKRPSELYPRIIESNPNPWIYGLNSLNNYSDERKSNQFENLNLSPETDSNYPQENNLTTIGAEGLIAYINNHSIMTSSIDGTKVGNFFSTSAIARLPDEYLGSNPINWVPTETFLIYSDPGEYQYTEWGTWQAEGVSNTAWNNAEGFKHVVMGIDTPEVNLQGMTGSATYNGDVKGNFTSGASVGQLAGSVTMNANFTNKTISGNFDLRRAHDNTVISSPTFSTSFSNEGRYSGDLNNLPGKTMGGVEGKFFGPQAQETGGSFYYQRDASGTLESATGVFRARQVEPTVP